MPVLRVAGLCPYTGVACCKEYQASAARIAAELWIACSGKVQSSRENSCWTAYVSLRLMVACLGSCIGFPRNAPTRQRLARLLAAH